MKYFFSLVILLSIISCSSDDSRDETIVDTTTINGTWRPARYEYKGKNYVVNACEKNGQININTDFSGVYERYQTDEVSGNCTKPESFTGKWNYDKMYSSLTLTYTESGIAKTLQKSIDGFSSTELRISDSSKNLDNVPGNDEAVLVFVKE